MYILKLKTEGFSSGAKFFIERLHQLSSTDEVISNRQPMTNGLILIHELFDVAEISMKRGRNLQRLKSLLQECSEGNIKTSLVSDSIIQRYYPYVLDWFGEIKKKDVNTSGLQDFFREISSIRSFVTNGYVVHLKNEVEAIDLSSSQFDVVSKQINDLLMIYIAQALYDGFSVGYIKRLCTELSRLEQDKILKEFTEKLTLEKSGKVQFLLRFNLGDEPGNVEIEDQELYLKFFNKVLRIPDDCPHPKFSVEGREPNAAVVKCMVRAFKKASLIKPDINKNLISESMQYVEIEKEDKFVPLFESDFQDPLIIKQRPNTLEKTIASLGFNMKDFDVRLLLMIEESLYFYNLALSAPSIENSYILMWTSLESLKGEQRANVSDIEFIQRTIARPLSLGAIGRTCYSIFQRLEEIQEQDGFCLHEYPVNRTLDSHYFIDRLAWTLKANEGTPFDPFEKIQGSPLTCKNWRALNEGWRTLGDLEKRVESSRKSIMYQLDRIYLTRNRIIHSGRFSKLGPYLWLHLEWYVGKILAQYLLTLKDMQIETVDPRGFAAGVLQGQYENVVHFLMNRRGVNIEKSFLYRSGLFSFVSFCF